MTYELAKELKDAGFRQPDIHNIGMAQFLTDQPLHEANATSTSLDYSRFVYAPTLSELIEVFKTERECLELYIDADGNTQVTCTSRSRAKGFIEGLAPEEAVARLWLALNSKSL